MYHLNMNVLLINPPARTKTSEPIIVPPLGLLYLASMLEKEVIPVSILDAFALGMKWEEYEKELKAIQPDIIGISSMTPIIDIYERAIKIARKYCKYIIIGGPHVSAYRSKIFIDIPEVDYALVGEAEYTFVSLIRNLQEKNFKAINKIPGIISREYCSAETPIINDLDSLPFPARHLTPINKYIYSLSRYKPVFTLMTSRGCPYQCIFCDKTISGSKYRPRSPENVVNEIEQIVSNYKAKSIIIYDDLFTIDKKRTIEICKIIINKKLNIEWKCEGRVDRIDDEMLDWMKKAGCSLIAYGVESGNLNSLKFLKKNFTPQQIKKAFELTHQYKIKTLAYFILGIPTETYSEALNSIKFAINLEPEYIQFSLLSPTYGTELYQLAQKNGWYYEIPAKNPLGKDKKRAVLLTNEWTEDKLQKIIRTAYLKFYFRPSYILNKLIQISSYRILLNSFKQGLRLLLWFFKTKEKKQTYQ